MGFSDVSDLIGGRAAWTVLGNPTEGAVGDRRRIAELAAPLASVRIGATIGEAQDRAAGSSPVAVLGDGDVLLGSLTAAALALPASTAVESAMSSAPGTIRPDLRVDDVVQQLRDDGLDHIYVTTASGVLIGLVTLEGLHV